MKTLFIDAYFLIAVVNPRDRGHEAALAFAPGASTPLVTTEWVLVEAGNSLSPLPLRAKFLELVDALRLRSRVTLVASTPKRFEDGLLLYRQRADKKWSLTDCLSFAVMKELGLTDALTADHHFEQAGFVALLRDR
jgi:uncharacterized protein